jgi:hypothetical protein
MAPHFIPNTHWLTRGNRGAPRTSNHPVIDACCVFALNAALLCAARENYSQARLPKVSQLISEVVLAQNSCSLIAEPSSQRSLPNQHNPDICRRLRLL